MSNKFNKKQRLFSSQDGLCFWCQQPMILIIKGRNPKDNSATFEHLIPKSKGGTNATENVVLACYKCNHKRNNKLVHPITRVNIEIIEAFSDANFTNILYDLQQGTCFWCDKKIKRRKARVDIIAYSSKDDIVLSCFQCKQTRTSHD